MTEPTPLEPDRDRTRRLAGRVHELLADTLAALDERPAADTTGAGDVIARLPDAPPEQGRDPGDVLGLVADAVGPTYETAGPGYLAYIPGGGIVTAALAEALAAGLNRYTGIAELAPACVAMEQSVLRWLCDLFGLPAGAQGLLSTGGSMANLIGLVAARSRHATGSVDRATVYTGEQAHASVTKAARIAGLDPAHVRTVPSGPDLRLDPDRVAERIAADRRAGLAPACVVAAAGTTNTGTIDPLDELATVAGEAGVWLHVDAAYGGFFQLTDRGARRMAGIERADSITIDPHKSLFLPYGTGAVLVRDAADLRRAFSEHADYLQDLGETPGGDGGDGALPDFNELSPELTRPWRGLRLWLPLQLHGVAAFRGQLDEKLDLTEEVHRRLARDPRLDVPWRPDLTVVAFRLAGAGDGAQRELLERINARQRVVLSSTRVEGDRYLRVAVLSHRTHAPRVRECLEIVDDAVTAVTGRAA